LNTSAPKTIRETTTPSGLPPGIAASGDAARKKCVRYACDSRECMEFGLEIVGQIFTAAGIARSGEAARKKCVRYARGANTRVAAFALMRTHGIPIERRRERSWAGA
jgi:hypothetical protein